MLNTLLRDPHLIRARMVVQVCMTSESTDSQHTGAGSSFLVTTERAVLPYCVGLTLRQST